MQAARTLILLALLLLPSQAGALWVTWFCAPTARLVCSPDEGCRAAEPQYGTVEFDREHGAIAYCRQEVCYEGAIEMEQEGAPDWRKLGVGTVEELPLPRAYRGGATLFASFETNARSLTLSSLSPWGQDITWFACEAAEW